MIDSYILRDIITDHNLCKIQKETLQSVIDKIEQGTLVELPDLACKFGVVEYCCQKKKPLKVVEYYPCCYEFSTKRIVLCWLCDNMNFRVVENGFDTREEAEKRLKELQG